jgi:hypothetical protein
MYQSTWMQQLMRLYLKPGHYALYSYVLTNPISHCKQTQDQPHISHILESEDCKQWAMQHITRSDWALECDKDYGRVIGQCGNKTYIQSLVETQYDPYGYFLYDLFEGIVRRQPLELIQWFMSITQKQQNASGRLLSTIIIQIACRYQRPDVLIYGLTLTYPYDEHFSFDHACNISIDKNDISCLEILRRDRLWDGRYAFRHAASCNNQFIFAWLHKTCPLERYDNIMLKYPYVNDWLKVIDFEAIK